MKERITHEILENELEIIKNRYPFLSVATVARSFRGRDIHIVGIGRGRARMLYVGCHHGAEGITSAVLLDYLKDISEIISRGGCVLGRKFDSFFDNNRIDVIPMLNPDGVELSVKGCVPTDPMYSRLVRMNGGSDDFTKWQANGRGVDLNHNYDFGFVTYKTNYTAFVSPMSRDELEQRRIK